MSPEETAPDPREDAGRRRARLWDRVGEGQAAVLPAGGPAWLWEAGRRGERRATLEALLPGALGGGCG